jgi:iron complex transport system ATP-binding protein
MSVLKAQDICVKRGGRTILGPVSIAVKTGELTVVVGPNGSGKSTLLRVLAGLWAPDTGSVSLDGECLEEKGRNDIARRIAFVPQDTHVGFDFTVAEIVAMGRYPHRGRFSPETLADRKAILSVAEKCDVAGLLSRSIATLSGGERQRALIARSLAAQPEFILLDEPTSNLDIEHSLEVLQLSHALAKQGHAVILASHDLNLWLEHATSMALLRAGRIVKLGDPNDVLTADALKEVFNVTPELIRSPNGSGVFIFRPRGPERRRPS